MKIAYAALSAQLQDASLLSLDVFDTVLLRDSSTETQRLAEAAARAAHQLGVNRFALRALRWDAQQAAYRAVALAAPQGEPSLAAICTVVARTIGLNDSAAQLMHKAEVEVDIEHLRPNRRMLDLAARARARGLRVIATSDTYYSAADLRQMFEAVLGENPFDDVYVSSELGYTKHAGGIFDVVAERENVDPAAVVHVGDDPLADDRNAARAGWRGVQVARGHEHRAWKLIGAAAALPVHRARVR